MSILPINFAATFPPERQYLSKMLLFLSKNPEKMSDQKISEKTDIPTGVTTGKVEPTLKYLKGMGIITPYNGWYRLSKFGDAVLKYDITFSQITTQMACHVNMCDGQEGSYLHSMLFTNLRPNKNYLKKEIVNKFSLNNDRPLTALVGMYTSNEGLQKCRMLSVTPDNDSIIIHSASMAQELVPVYGALIVHLYSIFFHKQGQVSIDMFDQKTNFTRILGWRDGDLEQLLQILAGKGYINIVAHLNPLVFNITIEEDKSWSQFYSEQV